MGDQEKSYSWAESRCSTSFANESGETSSTRPRKHDMALQLGPKDASFAADQTPTPGQLIRIADDLYQELQNVNINPFEETFKRASEARSSRHLLIKSQVPNGNDGTLHTPQIFPHLPDETSIIYTCKSDNTLTLSRSGSDENAEHLTGVKCLSNLEDSIFPGIQSEKEIFDINDKEKCLEKNASTHNKISRLKLVRQSSIDIIDSESTRILKQICLGGLENNKDDSFNNAEPSNITHSTKPDQGKTLTIPSIHIDDSETAEHEGFEILLKLPDGKKVHFKASQKESSNQLSVSNNIEVNSKLEENKNASGVKRKLKNLVFENMKKSNTISPEPSTNLPKKLPIRPFHSEILNNSPPKISPYLIQIPNNTQIIKIINVDSDKLLNGVPVTFPEKSHPNQILADLNKSFRLSDNNPSIMNILPKPAQITQRDISVIINNKSEKVNSDNMRPVKNIPKTMYNTECGKSQKSLQNSPQNKDILEEMMKKQDIYERNKYAQSRYRAKKKQKYEATLKINERLVMEKQVLETKLSIAMEEIKKLRASLAVYENEKEAIS